VKFAGTNWTTTEPVARSAQRSGLNLKTQRKMLNKKLIWRAAAQIKDDTFTISELVAEIEKEQEVHFDPNQKLIFKCDDIINVVTTASKLNRSILMTRSRRHDIVKARQIAMYLMGEYTKFTSTKIGFVFDRDHATVLHARKVIKSALNGFDPILKAQVEQAEKLLKIDGNGEIEVPFCELHDCQGKSFRKGLCQHHYRMTT
jgi:chromosomal replication initiation ATPase DnaA